MRNPRRVTAHPVGASLVGALPPVGAIRESPSPSAHVARGQSHAAPYGPPLVGPRAVHDVAQRIAREVAPEVVEEEIDDSGVVALGEAAPRMVFSNP